jgi:hypothetical protein
MREATVRKGRWLGLLLCCGLAGCVTTSPFATPLPETPNPFLEEILKQDPVVFKEGDKEIKPVPPRLKPDSILQAVPLNTPLAEARAVMERHGFSCWSGVQDNYRTCLYCTACRRKTPYLADKIVVKLFYEQKQVVDVEVTVQYDVARGFWGTF